MVILLGEIEGFSFPAKKSVDGLPLEYAILPDLFSTLQRSARDDDVHESSPFLDGFFDKAPETIEGAEARGGIHHPSAIDWRTLRVHVRR